MPILLTRWLRRIVLAAILCLSAFGNFAGPPADDVAIVVPQDVPLSNVSFAELRRLMLGEKQYWTSNLHVTLLARAPGSAERDIVLRTVYQMSEAQFRQYWIAKVFRAEVQSGPRVVYSSEMAAEVAESTPGALAYMDAAQVPKGLKILKINGLLPGQKGYPLR
ncbi:MAG TPA: hypothetical protein VMH80_24125 [Bryobacteraceae bacterium]|nr:hypothetical protein [Bryobacteraceae bacterium]